MPLDPSLADAARLIAEAAPPLTAAQRAELAAALQPAIAETAAVEFIDDRRVATLLDVKPGTVRSWRQRGGGPPFHRVGRRLVRYRRSEVVAWAASR